MASVIADDWAADFFRDADSFDLPTLVAWFADDVEVRFGNGPPVVGISLTIRMFVQLPIVVLIR